MDKSAKKDYERLKMLLQKAGVLGKIDLAKPPTPIKMISTDSVGDGDPLRVRAVIIPETFRIGENARVNIFFGGEKPDPAAVETMEIHATVTGNGGKFSCTTLRDFK